MRMLGVIAAAMAVVAWEPRAARACSFFDYNDFVPSSGTDTVAPTVAVAGASVWRGDGSCEGTGLIGIEVSGVDDQTPASQLGYLVRIVRSDGAMFPGLPTTPFNQFNNLSLHFNDHGQPIEVSLQVSAVDRDGNISAPVTATWSIPAATALAARSAVARVPDGWRCSRSCRSLDGGAGRAAATE